MTNKDGAGDLFLSGYGRHWGERVTFSSGAAYGVGAATGAVYGSLLALRKGAASPRLLVNGVLNSVAAHGSGLANTAAGVTMLYCVAANALKARRKDGRLTAPLAGGIAGVLFGAGRGLKAGGALTVGSAVTFTALDFAMKKGFI